MIAALGAAAPASMGDAGLEVWIEGEDRPRPIVELIASGELLRTWRGPEGGC